MMLIRRHSLVAAPPTHAESFGDMNEVVDLTQMPSDNEDLETTMSRLDISVSVTVSVQMYIYNLQ